jgi:2-polyprenyl-3-methyl-5-hydroxy-6-metoxy-1,4-benzoquinol methylase
MDQPGLDGTEHARALRGLARVNTLSRTAVQLWRPIERLSRSVGNMPVRVLDIACGGGDVALALASRSRSTGRDIRVEACDISHSAVSLARARASARGLDVRFFALDALTDPIPDGYDVITCTLFLHHLDTQDAAHLLRRVGRSARRLVLVDDLIRSRLGYVLAVAGCRLLSRSRLVRHDGPASVAGAFTVEEVRALAESAALPGAAIEPHWPRRFLLSWEPK